MGALSRRDRLTGRQRWEISRKQFDFLPPDTLDAPGWLDFAASVRDKVNNKKTSCARDLTWPSDNEQGATKANTTVFHTEFVELSFADVKSLMGSQRAARSYFESLSYDVVEAYIGIICNYMNKTRLRDIEYRGPRKRTATKTGRPGNNLQYWRSLELFRIDEYQGLVDLYLDDDDEQNQRGPTDILGSKTSGSKVAIPRAGQREDNFLGSVPNGSGKVDQEAEDEEHGDAYTDADGNLEEDFDKFTPQCNSKMLGQVEYNEEFGLDAGIERDEEAERESPVEDELTLNLSSQISKLLRDKNYSKVDVQALDYLFLPYHIPGAPGHYFLLGVAARQNFLFLLDAAQNTSPDADYVQPLIAIVVKYWGPEEDWYVYSREQKWKMQNQNEIDTQNELQGRKQGDTYNCGVFTVTSAFCLGFGFDLRCFGTCDLDSGKRPRMLAELCRGGLEDPPFSYDYLDIPGDPKNDEGINRIYQREKKRRAKVKSHPRVLPGTRAHPNRSSTDSRNVSSTGAGCHWYMPSHTQNPTPRNSGDRHSPRTPERPLAVVTPITPITPYGLRENITSTGRESSEEATQAEKEDTHDDYDEGSQTDDVPDLPHDELNIFIGSLTPTQRSDLFDMQLRTGYPPFTPKQQQETGFDYNQGYPAQFDHRYFTRRGLIYKPSEDLIAEFADLSKPDLVQYCKDEIAEREELTGWEKWEKEPEDMFRKWIVNQREARRRLEDQEQPPPMKGLLPVELVRRYGKEDGTNGFPVRINEHGPGDDNDNGENPQGRQSEEFGRHPTEPPSGEGGQSSRLSGRINRGKRKTTDDPPGRKPR